MSEQQVDAQVSAALKEEIDQVEELAEVRLHDDHTREVRTPGFSRMRVDWHGDDLHQVERIKGIIDGRVMSIYPDAFVLMNDLYEIVREPVLDEHGEKVLDRHGLAVWRRSESGAFVEDFSRLGIRERENFLFRITSNIFEWKQTQVDLWGEAMFAKAQWEESFSSSFVQPSEGRMTVDDRTNRARSYATEERYFAIFQSLLSRRADAVVSSMELLAQRLKDVLTT